MRAVTLGGENFKRGDKEKRIKVLGAGGLGSRRWRVNRAAD